MQDHMALYPNPAQCLLSLWSTFKVFPILKDVSISHLADSWG